MGRLLDQARAIRAAMDAAGKTLDDGAAYACAALFPLWDGGGRAYKTGDRLRYGGELYKVLLDHTSQADWLPGSAPSLYVRIDDPTVEWPAWRKPAGAADAYPLGAKVSHNGKRWISTVAANVWEPGVSGWEEQVA